MTTRRKSRYIVANPRHIPAGHYVIRVGDKRWFEGDVYDGPPNKRFERDGFVIEEKEVNDGQS